MVFLISHTNLLILQAKVEIGQLFGFDYRLGKAWLFVAWRFARKLFIAVAAIRFTKLLHGVWAHSTSVDQFSIMILVFPWLISNSHFVYSGSLNFLRNRIPPFRHLHFERLIRYLRTELGLFILWWLKLWKSFVEVVCVLHVFVEGMVIVDINVFIQIVIIQINCYSSRPLKLLFKFTLFSPNFIFMDVCFYYFVFSLWNFMVFFFDS